MEEIKENVELVADEATGEGILQFQFAGQVGPIGLLVYLVKKNKLEIEDVKLADITDQYLKMIEGIEQLDLDTASEFIVMATELIEIKSKSLLPSEKDTDVDEEDPEYLIKMRMKEYELMQEMSLKLKQIENTEVFYKNPEPEAGKYRIKIKDMQLDALLDAFTRFMLKNVKKEAEAVETKQVIKERYTVEQKIANIKDALLVHKSIKFSQLMSQSTSKNEIVTTFMALLELLKLQTIKVNQGDLFEDIDIIRNEEANG